MPTTPNPITPIECSECGSHAYQLLDEKTGEVICLYCRSKWIVPSLIQKTETEKFLELQTQQPKLVVDNTTETDKKLMDMLTGLFSFNVGGCLRQALGVIIGIVVLIVLVVVIVNVL